MRGLLHWCVLMSQRYCDVALPVPLRATFTYAVPATLDGEDLIGRRVVVPFRNRSLVGVGLAESDRAPDVARSKNIKTIKEIAELMDTVPALPPKLIELGHWISRYYLAPIGETFSAMLPPEVELRHDREYSLTVAGRAHAQQLLLAGESTDIESAERDLLRHCGSARGPIVSATVRKWPGGETAAERLVRHGYLVAREVLSHRKMRTQKILAWNPEKTTVVAGEAEKKIHEVLAATRGPLPLGLLAEKAGVSRVVIRRLEKDPVDPIGAVGNVGFPHPDLGARGRTEHDVPQGRGHDLSADG